MHNIITFDKQREAKAFVANIKHIVDVNITRDDVVFYVAFVVNVPSVDGLSTLHEQWGNCFEYSFHTQRDADDYGANFPAFSLCDDDVLATWPKRKAITPRATFKRRDVIAAFKNVADEARAVDAKLFADVLASIKKLEDKP